MAKFVLTLRKKMAASPFSSTESASKISGPLADPLSSLQDRSSPGTLPSSVGQMKFKFFSSRWNNRRTNLSVNRLVEGSNSCSFGRLALRDSVEFNPDITRSSSTWSKKAPSFLMLFSQASRSSWRNKHRTKSDTPVHSFTAALGDATTVSKSASSLQVNSMTTRPTAQPVRGNVDLLGRHEDHGSYSPNLVEGTEVFQALKGGQEPIFFGVDSSRCSDQGSWSILPVPPIIISAPTPPDSMCFANENGGQELVHWQVNSNRKFVQGHDVDWETNVPMVIKTLHGVARQLQHDPTFTQKRLFRLSAPITAFLYSLGFGVIMLKKEQMAAYFTLFILLGMLLVLTLLRGIIWVMSKFGHSFCELNLEEVFTRGIFVDSEGERLTDADFIVGNLIT